MYNKNTKLFSVLNGLQAKYSLLIKEDENKDIFSDDNQNDEDNTENENNNDDEQPFPVSNENEDSSSNSAKEDPTVTPEENVPSNEKGSYISDTKLAMLVTVLAKAATSAPIKIPADKLPVTSENAYKLVDYIENKLNISGTQNKVENILGKIN